MQQLHAPLKLSGAMVIVLAVVSLLLPLAALVPLRGGAGVSSAVSSDYRVTVAALVGALIAALISLVGSRSVSPRWLRWGSLFLAIGGLVLSVYLFGALIGTCGLGVLAGTCRP